MRNQKLPDPNKYFSIEAEAGVLGSMLLDPEIITKILPRVPLSEAFFKEEHRIIYDALIKLYIAGTPIDAISLRTELKQQNQLEAIGGVSYLQKILESLPHAANGVYYAGVIRSMQKEREIISAVADIAAVPDDVGTPDEKIEQIQSVALSLVPVSTGPDFIEIGSEAAIIAAEMGTTQDGALKSGFKSIDRLINGFYPGELIILAGRPSMGKSALMLDFALNIAKGGSGVLLFSLEMTPRALIERAICNLACLDSQRVQAGHINADETTEIYNQAAELQKLNILISKVGEKPEQIAGLIHRLKQTHNISAVFLDYMQLMSTGSKSESRQQEITTISRKLKAVALREAIPLVVLSQLNRAPDARDNHRPRMSDLRESGSIEQDADVVLFTYRDDYYRKDEPGFEPSGMAEIIVSKNRRGPTGVANLVFVHDEVKFADLPPAYNMGGGQYVSS